MPLLPYLVYHLLKGILLLALPFHYPDTAVLGREYLRVKGPTLVVSNHPNTLMDPLNIVIRVNRPVFFLANASIFKHPLAARLLRFLFTLPVERAQDAPGRRVHNRKNFSAVIRHLAGGGNIWIAPEGGSARAWQLRPLKSGTARIALQALEHLQDPQALTILPVGLTYATAGRPGGGLVVQAGPPIRVQAFAALYREHPRLGVRKLTEAVRAQLEPQLVHCSDAEEERRLRWADELAQSQQPLPFVRRFHRLQLGAYRLAHWPAARREAWATQADALRAQLKEAGIPPAYLADRCCWPPLFLEGMLILLGFPLALWGLLHNLLPLGIPWLVQQRLEADEEYDDTIRVLAGMLSLPLFYALQVWLAARFLSVAGAGLYLLSLPLLAYLSWYYFRWIFERLPGRWRFRTRASAPHWRAWLETRAELLQLFRT